MHTCFDPSLNKLSEHKERDVETTHTHICVCSPCVTIGFIHIFWLSLTAQINKSKNDVKMFSIYYLNFSLVD